MLAIWCYALFVIVAYCGIVLVYFGIVRLLCNDYKKAKRLNGDSINVLKHNNIITKVPTIQRLQYFPLIFVVCFFWEMVSIFHHSFAIKIMQIAATNLYSAFNALLFVYVLYNFSGNQVTYRNPNTIGTKRRRKCKSKAAATDDCPADRVCPEPELTVTDTQNGVMVTATTLTRPVEVDELSTISLNIGNVLVMTPTAMATEVTDSVDDATLNSEEQSQSMNDVVIGYNEDESDYLFSLSCSDIELAGDIEVMKSNEMQPLSTNLSNDSPHDAG